MEMKLFRATNSLEIGKMEVALNAWLQTLPQTAVVHHTNTAYCALDGVPSVAVTVFFSADKPQLSVPVAPA